MQWLGKNWVIKIGAIAFGIVVVTSAPLGIISFAIGDGPEVIRYLRTMWAHEGYAIWNVYEMEKKEGNWEVVHGGIVEQRENSGNEERRVETKLLGMEAYETVEAQRKALIVYAPEIDETTAVRQRGRGVADPRSRITVRIGCDGQRKKRYFMHNSFLYATEEERESITYDEIPHPDRNVTDVFFPIFRSHNLLIGDQMLSKCIVRKHILGGADKPMASIIILTFRDILNFLFNFLYVVAILSLGAVAWLRFRVVWRGIRTKGDG